ncbi:enoyl-CoA hydratase/isomerase family protein [Cupriavidus lacunae]|uniref:Enoyl-CoA hydratase n=1 Tax=Cupriavidus lacunae TaxID=2666307 RepID=A0A370NMQ0_9BURK|nr:enoyl-CoA hydratase-related protein [Cupriavidus lacunae]RDK06887.1 enoyl-CoA hydratase [Cupriavidus lacunae]
MSHHTPASDVDYSNVLYERFANIIYEKHGNTAHLTISRPEAMNALNSATMSEIGEAIADARDDPAVRGVIITGAGKAFVAGADINDLVSLDALSAERSTAFGQGVMSLIENLSKPVIAAVNGYALGGGCELAMACTIRIASQHARFGQPEVKLGVVPGYGGTQRLPRLVGKGPAMQLILTGQVIDAQEAMRIGLVNEVVPAESLLARAQEILDAISANAPIATRLAMEAVNRGESMPLPEALAFERTLFAICASSEDKGEGTSAFVAKRKAVFQGR